MKRIIAPSLFALFVIATGCNEKTSQNQTVNQVKKEAVTQVPHPKVERGGEWIEAYAIGTSGVPFKDDDLIPIRKPDEFTEFSTPLPIGDKIVITVDTEVYKASKNFRFDPPVAISAQSTVYFIGEAGNGEIRIVDEDGNAAWISENDAQYVMQKKYTSSDSMIEKKWKKSGYDVAKFSPDGKLIALLSWNYNRSSEDAILICDRSSGKRKFSIQAKLDQTNSICCAFSPDSRYFYYITEDKYLNQADLKEETVNHFGSPTPDEIKSDGRWEHLRSVHPLPDGENVLVGVYYEPWAMLNTKTGEWTYKKNEDFMWANSFAFSPDGKYIAGSAINPSDICVWEAESKKLVWQRTWEFSGNLYYSPDGNFLYAVNGIGITKLDAKTGKTLSRTEINIPTCLTLVDYAVLPKKDRVAYSLNKGYFTYLYFYELSTGNLVQVEHIEEDHKQINGIELSPDGKMISLHIADGSRVWECHQTVCSINLDKKAKSVPKIKRESKEEKYIEFLTNNNFNAGWWKLSFYEDGFYSLSARHDGSFYGNWTLRKNAQDSYSLEFSSLIYSSFGHTSDFPQEDKLHFDTWKIEPDYEDFDFKGYITNERGKTFYSNTQSPSGKTYELDGAKVIKRQGENKYIYINENTKMRTAPSLSAEPVSLSYFYYDDHSSGYVKSRIVVFAGEYFHVIGETEKTETIDGVTSPWYLIYEDDNNGGEYTESRRVWVYGGFSTEFDGSEIETYREKGKSDLRESIMGKGILNYNTDDYYHEERRSWD